MVSLLDQVQWAFSGSFGKIWDIITTGVSHDVFCWARFQPSTSYHGWRSLFQSGGTSARQKIYRKCLWFELATVTSQPLEYDVISCTSYEGLNCAILDKITPLWKRIKNHLKLKKAVTGATQVNSVTRAHTIYSDWIKPCRNSLNSAAVTPKWKIRKVRQKYPWQK